MNNERNVIKSKCDEIGMVFRAIFWFMVLYVMGNMIYCIWIFTRPGSHFMVETVSFADSIIALAGVKDGVTIRFGEGILSQAAVNHPKLVYMTGIIANIFCLLVMLYLLWNVRNIFRNIDKEETPFSKGNSKALFQVGIAFLIHSFIKKCILPAVCFVMGVGGGTIRVIDMYSLLIGGLVICLSYIFAYGARLQEESDELL